MHVVDGNEAAAAVAYRMSEVIAIYPITPSSPMGEWADEWATRGRPNLWGVVPSVTAMQSEGGAAGAVHGALQGGALATTFTASQGLLLMIPNMYKIAGELTPCCMHVAARTLATHALSIFGDHSDVMACRQTGFALLASGSVQEAQDLACIAHAATLDSRIPFLHFFDGFRTSHEVACITPLSDDDLRAVLDDAAVAGHRSRALTPDRPVLRGTAQNPDTFFQAREAGNGHYLDCPGIVRAVMQRFAQRTGRTYDLFEYHGAPDAEAVVVLMGSGAVTARQTADALNRQGRRVGVVTVRLYRPFDAAAFIQALPPTVRRMAVLDRTKEPGAIGEPLLLDVCAALGPRRPIADGPQPQVIGGRYGLSSKEFTPAMVRAVFDELAANQPAREFTVGITDDVTRLSLAIDPEFDIEPPERRCAIFHGLGSDGTVGANKNTIKIVGQHANLFAQGYFVYDSKKSGAQTVSHLRFDRNPIGAPYLVRTADFVACHQFQLLERGDVLDAAAPGATVLLNVPVAADAVWDRLPASAQRLIIERDLRVHVIDAQAVATQHGLGTRINTIMQTCFFALTDLLPVERAVELIKDAIRTTYRRKGDDVVERNCAAVDAARSHLQALAVPDCVSAVDPPPRIPATAPDFVQRVTAVLLAGHGDDLPVSAFPVDGTWPTGTTRWEKRSIATEIPEWDPTLCIQCNKCAFVCPHAAIRAKVYDDDALAGAPEGFQSNTYKAPDFRGARYTIQVAPDDCTGCRLCVNVCPAKDRGNPRHKAIDMTPVSAILERERSNFSFFCDLPETPVTAIQRLDVKGSQLLLPLFEFSGACAGCGETPYIKLVSQLFGDHALIANATGCSSIYGGNLPTTPYTVDACGRGPAWANSLFEDNAEFGLGLRLAVDAAAAHARTLIEALRPALDPDLAKALLAVGGREPQDIAARRTLVDDLRGRLETLDDPRARVLSDLADYLVHKSVWLMGGDGWAYDIGYGGLDHVLASTRDVNVLVLDTEVYSNTGGQASKATPLGAAAKFAAAGKGTAKKDLGLMAMHYGHVYVASIAFGAKDNHTVQVIREAESYPGPSLIIAYSHCIAHGYDMQHGVSQQALAVDSGIWPLYRYDPRRLAAGEAPLVLDAKPGGVPVANYMRNETRFRMVERRDPQRFKALARAAQDQARQRIAIYEHLAALRLPQTAPPRQPAATP